MYKKEYFRGIVIFCIVCAVFVVYLNVWNKKNNQVIEVFDIKKEDDIKTEENIESNINNNFEKQNIKYVNNKYQYGIIFPENWYINNDNSESDIKIVDGMNIAFGGQTFLSNYSNINDFSPSNHPDDFHLLAMTVYEDDSNNIDEFVQKIGYDSDVKKVDFEANNISGKEIVAPGLVKGNPRIAVIFKKNNLFYVFNLGFVGGDSEVVVEMENIIKTFKLKD
jgi:hypothetical protein